MLSTCLVGVLIVGVGGSQNPFEYISRLELWIVVPRQYSLGGSTGASQSDLKEFLSKFCCIIIFPSFLLPVLLIESAFVLES